MRKRKIKKIGGSLFIPLSKSDVEDYGLVEGDDLDLDELFKDFIPNYRCMKCEGKDVSEHGLYCKNKGDTGYN